MTKKAEVASLKTPLHELLINAEDQVPYARKALKPGASEAEVMKEAQRRADRARELLKSLEKRIGTSLTPYPMSGLEHVNDAGTLFTKEVMSFIRNDVNAIRIYSERTMEEILALAYCDMPVPSILPYFIKGLERRRPESRNRQHFLIGDPGHGKSFMAALGGRLRTDRPVTVFDCGGRSINELLFEMVLDFGTHDSLPKAIDKRIREGRLEQLSYGQLALLNELEAMPKEVDEDDEQKKKWIENATIVTYDKDGRPVIDWAKLKTGSAEKIDKAFAILERVRLIEGLDKDASNTLGMNSQYGPLVKAFINDEEIVLDEYNKSRDGSDNMMQRVLQFLNGEIDSVVVPNPLKGKDGSTGPEEFEFKREDMGIGFFVTFTGNKTEDGTTTRSLNQSVYDRLQPDTLPDPGVLDYKHRFCQTLTGVPISTLYLTYKDFADSNPQAFGEWLLKLRRIKARIDGATVPKAQEKLLRYYWKDISDAADSLGPLTDNASILTDAKRTLQHLMVEVDDEFTKKEIFGLRKLMALVSDAMIIHPKMEPEGAVATLNPETFFNDPAPLDDATLEDPLEFLGTRLVGLIEERFYQISEALRKPELYKELCALMKNACLRDIVLKDGEHSTRRSLEQCLNISPFSSNDISQQAVAARKVFCDYVRSLDPRASKNDEDIITVKKFADALKKLGDEKAEVRNLQVVNSNPDTFLKNPLVGAYIEDDYAYFIDGGSKIKPEAGDLVMHDELMTSLAMPTVGAKNLSAVWEDHISFATEGTPEGEEPIKLPEEEGLYIAENRSDTGLAMTTLRVAFADAAGVKETSVHIIRNSKTDKTVIVGEKISSRLQAAFRSAGISYIDRSEDGAERLVETALKGLTVGMPTYLEEHLAVAFGYRNKLESPTGNRTLKQVAQMVTDGNVQPLFAKYLFRGAPKKHAA